MQKKLDKKEDLVKSLSEKVALIEKQIGTGDSLADNSDICDVEPLRTDLTDCKTPAVDMFPRVQANGSTHEWNVITSTGAASGCGNSFIETCGTPNCTKPEMARYSVQIKVSADCADVCEFNQEASARYLDLQATARLNSMRIISQDVECTTFYGDTSANPLEFDGLERLTLLNAPGNYVNGAGAAFSLATLARAIRLVAQNCGSTPTHIFMGAKDIDALNTSAGMSATMMYQNPGQNQNFGWGISTLTTSWGRLQVVYDPFITPQADGLTDIFIVSMPSVAYAQLGNGIQSMPLARTGLSKAEALFWKVALEVRNFNAVGVYANIA